MNNIIIQSLNQIIEQKQEMFEELYSITILQQEDIDNNQGDNIEALVQQKQNIIDRVDRLDEEFLTGYKKLKETLKLDSLDKVDVNQYPELKIIKSGISSIMEIARRIMELEKINGEKLNAIFQGIKNELRQINTGKRSLKAYEAPPVYNDGIFIDKKK